MHSITAYRAIDENGLEFIGTFTPLTVLFCPDEHDVLFEATFADCLLNRTQLHNALEQMGEGLRESPST